MKLTMTVLLVVALVFVPMSVTAQDSDRSYDPVLGELADADNPESFAESRGLSYDNGTVTVVMELETDAEPPDGYSVEVVQTYKDGNESLVEARIPIENVRGISQEPTVRYVRVPSTPVTTNGPVDESANETGDEIDENVSANDTDSSPPEDSDGFTVLLALIATMLVVSFRRDVDE